MNILKRFYVSMEYLFTGEIRSGEITELKMHDKSKGFFGNCDYGYGIRDFEGRNILNVNEFFVHLGEKNE